MISAVRTTIAGEITSNDPPWPVYTFMPDDVNEVPCIVVSRPTVNLDVQHQTYSTPVLVIGRRDGTEDAQTELDTVTDWVARAIAGPDLAVLTITPGLSTVADLTYPTYEIAVSCGITVC